jgi:hypothetical protein
VLICAILSRRPWVVIVYSLATPGAMSGLVPLGDFFGEMRLTGYPPGYPVRESLGDIPLGIPVDPQGYGIGGSLKGPPVPPHIPVGDAKLMQSNKTTRCRQTGNNDQF